jgi:hypothetical protein
VDTNISEEHTASIISPDIYLQVHTALQTQKTNMDNNIKGLKVTHLAARIIKNYESVTSHFLQYYIQHVFLFTCVYACFMILTEA